MQNEVTSLNIKNPIIHLTVYGLIFFALGIAGVSLGPLLPTLAETTGRSLSQISFIFTARSLGYLVGSFSGAYLYDRVNAHKLMILCLGLMVMGQVVIPLHPTYILMLSAMFIIGMGHAAIDIGGNVNLLWLYQSKVGPYMNAMHFCFGIGAFLSPILIYQTMNITDGGLEWPFWSLAITFLPGIFSLIFLKAPQNPEKDMISSEDRKNNSLLIILMMVLFFLYVGVEGGFGGWIYTYVTKGFLMSETTASYMNSLFWGALTFGRLISIPLARKFKLSRLLVLNFSLAVINLALILIWPSSEIMMWIGSVGFGLSLSSVFPTLMALSETRLMVTGKVTSLFFVGVSFGGIVMPMLLGQIFDFIGSYYVMVALFAATIIGLVVLLAVIFLSIRLGEKQRS
jgi:FHS family Na+ dependent glucose MFS transporter 1